MRKLKLFFAALALLTGGGNLQSLAQPTASTPTIGNTYYLYNPATKLFMTTNVDLPFIRPTGSAWKLEEADGQQGWITLRLKDSSTDGAGYFWGKWWANNPNANSSEYAGERVFQLEKISDTNYKLLSNAWRPTESYIYINNGNEGDRSFRLACNSYDQAGLDEGYVTWQFISEADYDTYMADDYTSRISNNDFLNGVTGWTLVGSGNMQAHGNTAIEYWNASAASGSFDYYQNLTNLPAGKYVLRAAMYNSTNGEEGASFDAAGQCGVYGTSNGVTEYANVTVDGTAYNIYTTDALLVPDGNLRLGFKNSTTMTARWFGADWIQLTCIEYCLSAVATALPAGGTMEADTWYYYDLPTSDEYEFTLSNAATLTYSADGTQLISEATGTDEAFSNVQTKNLNLSAGRLYFKTNAASTLTVSYKYNVGSATSDITSIQGGKTVTISWADASSNDPSASFAKIGSPSITFNGSAVEVTTTSNGFTFTVPSGLTANTAYTLAIPAGAFGYASGSTYNAAQNITLNTPAVFDGTYFLKAAATYDGSSEGTSAAVGKYMARGTAYSTHLSLDSYGLPVAITTNGSNQTILKMADTNGYVFSTDSYDAYADGSDAQKTSFTISVQNSKYLIASNNRGAGKYLKYNTAKAGDEEISVFDDGTGTNSGPIIMWAIESISEHATAMQAKKDAQAAAAAAAAYASGNYASLSGITTVTALESELTANYIEGAFVSPTTITSVEESYQPRNNTGDNLVPKTVYSNTIEITEAGFYKFSMQAFNRATWNENVQAMHEIGADMPAAVLFFGDSETQIKSLYDEVGHDTAVEGANPEDASYNGKYYANCKASALKMFQDGKYHNDVWFYCSTPGTYTYGVKVMGYANGQWFIYSPQSVTITSYAAAASESDYTALATAISAYDAATWGFDVNEYAPYNNLEAINNIAAAKAIKSEETNSKLLVNSLSAKIALTANESQLNAVYNGTFALTANDGAPAGWVLTGATGSDNSSNVIGGQYRPRAFVPGASDANYAKLASFNQAGDTRSAFYVRFDDRTATNAVFTYGETEGYTMPLKAATYRLKAKAGGWGKTLPLQFNIVNSTDEPVVVKSVTLEDIDKTGTASDYIMYFLVTTPGTYKLKVTNSSGESNAAAISNIELYPTSTVEFVDGQAVPAYAPGTYSQVKLTRTLAKNRWYTAVYPFAISADESGYDQIAVLDSYDPATGVLKFKSADASEANVPFLFRGTNSTFKDEAQPVILSWSNVNLGVASTELVATAGQASLIGTYEEQTLSTNEEYKNYVLSNNTIYPVGAAGATIPAYRAYIQIAQAGNAARSLKFVIDGEETTGIDGIAAESVSRGEVYNLNGQRVASPRKGLYIQNGKKVLVK